MKLLVLLALFFLAPRLIIQAADAPKSLMKSTVFDWNQLEVKTTKTGERRELFDGPTATLNNFEGHITTLKAGETAHPAHTHPDEEMIIVKDGTLEVTINGESKRAGAGSVFFYASHDLHGMRNVGATTATYFVFRFVTTKTPAAK